MPTQIRVESPKGTVVLGGIGYRLLAYVIDVVLAFLTAFAVVLPVTLLTYISEYLGPLITIAWVLGFLGYWAVSYAKWGRTLGMRLCDLRVIDSLTAENLSWGRAALRSIVLTLVCVPFGWIIWLVWTASSDRRQGPQDLAGRSLVIVQTKGFSAFVQD